jgi:hypothetical protein
MIAGGPLEAARARSKRVIRPGGAPTVLPSESHRGCTFQALAVAGISCYDISSFSHSSWPIGSMFQS